MAQRDALVAGEEIAGRGAGSVLEYTPPRTPGLLHGFRALRHPDFRLFYSGQFFSLVGTWMQGLAEGWLILILTNSSLALGLDGAARFLPVLLLSAFGGAIADRAPKRWILVGTQTAQMILAFALAFLTFANAITFVDVLILAFLLGVASSVDMPTRQAFVVELVGPSDLMNAIALNSSMFNVARLGGPALAGILIGIVGLAGCFLLNGLSFLAVIVSLLLMRPPTQPARHLMSIRDVLSDLREGFLYVRQAPALLAVIGLMGAVGMLGVNFNVVLPILAKDVLLVGATGLGWLMTAMGAGSLLASLAVAYGGKRPRPRVVIGGALVFGLTEIALAPVSSFALALALLVIIGGAMALISAVANTYVQASVPHRLRGRVMSIYMTVFVGTTPIGNTLVGAIAVPTAALGPLLLGGVGSLIAAIVVGRLIWNTPAALVLRRHGV